MFRIFAFVFSLIVDFICGQKCQVRVYDSNDYVGCFVDTHDRLLPHAMITSTNTDNNRCILHCRDAGYMYAGTEVGTYCFCGNNPWRYSASDVADIYVKNFDCSFGCHADVTQKCGGDWRLSVYNTGFKNYVVQSVLGRKRQTNYTKMDVDRKIDKRKTAISSLNVRSTADCGKRCSLKEICNCFVYSTITGKCQLYQLKYHDLCDYTDSEVGSSIYMID